MRLVTVALALGPVVTAAKLDDDAGSAQTPFSYEEQEDVEAADAGWGSEGPLTRDFRQKVNHWLGEWHVPGLAVGVVDGDETWTKGYGIATYPSNPVTPKTLFYGASTSKAFTAAALSIMIASGNYSVPSSPFAKLDWTTPIASLIPDDFVLMDDAWATAHITLEDALSHRTGLPRHDKSTSHWVDGEDGDRRVATPRDVVRSLRYLPLNAAPRTKWQYCNQMFVVASHVIETLTQGRWLGSLLREWIWTPLNMSSTYFSLEDALQAQEHLASGYSYRRDTGEFEQIPYMAVDEVSGAGSVISCVEDYVKWIRMLLRGEGPVPPDGHAAVKTPRMFSDPRSILASYGNATEKKLPYDAPLGYAFGWWTGSYRGHAFWTHSGGMHAYGAEVFFFPGLDFGVVTFGNTALTSNHVGLFVVWQLVDNRLGLPEERYDWEDQYRGFNEKIDANIANAINKTFPHRPSTPIPAALPLAAYEGTYYHPAYLNFTLELTADKTTFVANRSDATWLTINTFEHVSGEYWMVFQQYAYGDRNGPATEYAPVEFRVGADGKVAGMEVRWLEVEMAGPDTVEGLVWFDKIV